MRTPAFTPPTVGKHCAVGHDGTYRQHRRQLTLVEVAVLRGPSRLVLLDHGGGGLRGQHKLELGSIERVCCLVGSHQ